MDQMLAEELRDAVDDVWSEAIRHLPLADGRQDPAREPSEIQAVLRTGERKPATADFRGGRRSGAGVMADGGYLRIDRLVYPDLIVRRKDKVVALDRPGAPMFEVLGVDDRSHLRLICDLGDTGG